MSMPDLGSSQRSPSVRWAWARRATVLAVAGTLLVSSSAVVGAASLVKVSDPDPYINCSTAGQSGRNFPDTEVEPYVAVNPATLDGARAAVSRANRGNARASTPAARQQNVRARRATSIGSNNNISRVNLIGVWQQDRWENGGARGLAAGFSFDSGETWGLTPLQFSRCAVGGLPYERASDPWVSIGPDGTAYTVSLSFDSTTNRDAVAAATSTDGGRTWANLQVINAGNDPTRAQDKESVTADPTRAGVAYIVWDEIRQSNCNPQGQMCRNATVPTLFSKTMDGGRTWSKATVIVNTQDREQTIGNQIVVDPGTGALYNFFDLILFGRGAGKSVFLVAFVKSTDGGATWSRIHIVNELGAIGVRQPGSAVAEAAARTAAVDALDIPEPMVHSRPLRGGTGQVAIQQDENEMRVRTGDILPEAAIDPATGQLFVVWQDARFSGGRFDEVALSTSTDEGSFWSMPVRVNTPTEGPAFTPSVQVADDGTVGVTFYDFRNHDSSNRSILLTDYWITFSDDGTSFGGEQHVSGPFNMRAAPPARGFFVGDYEGLATIGNNFVPFFSQANCIDNSCAANRGGPNPTDIYTGQFEP